MLSPILSNDSFKWKSNVEVTRRWTAYLWPPHAASTGRNARSVGWEGRRRVEEMARASVPRVSLPRGAYLSLRCARDILISYTYIYIHVSPPLCVVSVYLLPSVYASIPFDPFFFLFIAVPLYPSSSTLFPFCSPLSMIISLAFFPSCCVYTPVVHVCFSLSPFLPLLFFFSLRMDSAGPRGGIDVDTDTDTGHAVSVSFGAPLCEKLLKKGRESIVS